MTNEEWIGVVQIRSVVDGEIYASCPMTASNLPMLLRWLMNNHEVLAEGEDKENE